MLLPIPLEVPQGREMLQSNGSILKPFYELLDALCERAHEMEIAKGIDGPVIPHATEFFPFLLTTLELVKRRKAWTGLF